MRKEASYKAIYLTFGILVICLAIASYAIAQWTEPTAPPPGGNVATPLNVSAVTQSKQGALGIQGVFQAQGGSGTDVLNVIGSNVGIGTPIPGEKLTVTGIIETTVGGIKFPDGTLQITAATASGFPSPDYTSPWISIGAGATQALTHNIGGNSENYLVDLTCRSATGIHNWGNGLTSFIGATGEEYEYGATWSRLTSTTIRIYRGFHDTATYCNEIRIRIWAY